MRSIVTVVLLLVLGPTGLCGQSTVAAERDLRLEPGDAVRVQVGGEPDLGGDFGVDPSGAVLLPLVGLVQVAGLPFPEVRERIVAGFAAELLDPVVTVVPVIRIPVLGEVRNPGLLNLDPTYSLAEILAFAGGLTPDADPERILLLRSDGPRQLSLDLPGGEMLLRPGDEIMVGRRGWLSRNYAVVISVGGSVMAAVLTALILR